MKNREKIYECITNTTVSNPQPSSSRNYSSGTVTASKNSKSTKQDVISDDFSDDFEISENDLVTIDELSQKSTSKPPTISIKTTVKRKVLSENNKQIPSTHFMTKPPINVFAKKRENEPALKIIKNNDINDHTSKITSENLSTNLNLNNRNINCQNCIFSGDIVFDCSNITFQNCVFYGSIKNDCGQTLKNERN